MEKSHLIQNTPSKNNQKAQDMYFLGFDIGSSSVKAALVRADTKEVIRVVSAPSMEMPMDAPQKGFAEQDPGMWWKYVCECSRELMHEHPEEIGRAHV